MFMIAYMANKGSFSLAWSKALIDPELWYHFIYCIFALLGLYVHEFFYSILVTSILKIK